MTPFTPRRFLISGAYVGGLADRIVAIRPDLEFRRKSPETVSAADLDWAEAFIGFRKPAVSGWGAVRWIHCIGAGVDGLIAGGPIPPGTLLTKSGEDFGPAIGEWCLARALAVNQFLDELRADQAARRWNRDREPILLRGQRVLVLGTGQVGGGIARAFGALGARVDGLSRSGAPAPGFERVAPVADFAGVVPGCRWLVLAAPLTPETRGWLNRERMRHCAGAYLMNVGRGALVDESVIIEAIEAGHLSGAALDVFAVEPLPDDSPLWGHPRVTISPHVSGPSTLDATLAGFLETLEQLERGGAPRLSVDPARGY